jgi:hypothetical protein
MDPFNPSDVQYVSNQAFDDRRTSAFTPQSSSFAMSASEIPQGGAPTAPSRQVATRAPRPRHRDLKWDDFKVALRKLYLEDNKTLGEIRQKMLLENSFDAT